MRMLATGKVEITTGTSAHGQGHETAFSQIVADRLGVAFEDVEILHGDTQVSHRGLDTYGSRSLVVGGEALVRAADKVIEKAKPIAAHLLEASVDDIEFSAGRFGVRGTDQGLAMADIAMAAFAAHNLPDGVEASLDSDATYDPVNFNYPHGTHLCAMEVDTETGGVLMRKYTCVDDIGTVINPMIVEGQVHGGLAQGIAQALWEEAVYDDSGTLVSGSFVDYLLPTSADTISFDVAAQLDGLDHQHARHQGRRRGRHHRLDPGGRQRRRRRDPAPRDQRHPDAVHPRARLARHPRRGWQRHHGHGGGGHAALRRVHRHAGHDGPHGRSRRMIPTQFEYLAPTSVDEALAALAQHGDEAKVIAGGQSLLPVLRMRLNAPEVVIDLGGIEALRGVREDGDVLVIGAMTTHHAVLHDPLVAEHAALLTKAEHQLADAQIRHRGTIGGALAHADPAGDLGAPSLALGAEFVIAGPGGTRTVAADDFFVDLFETAIAEGELLTEIRVPKHTGWGAHYEKFVRVAHQWPIVAVAAAVRVEGGTIAEARVGLTNMGSTPLRARAVEEALVGQPATEDAVATAAARAAEGTNPPSDLNGAADYRTHLAKVLTRRAVLAAAGA